MLTQAKHSKSLRDLSISDIRRYLDSWHIDSISEATIKGRLPSSLKKIHLTLQYLPSDAGRILQIGSSPFFLSSLLTRFGHFDLELVDFAHLQDGGSTDLREAKIADGLEPPAPGLTYRAFDIETEPFPYEDDEFGGIVMCDVLQRFTRDPIVVLAEIHRMLKPGGWFLFTRQMLPIMAIWLTSGCLAIHMLLTAPRICPIGTIAASRFQSLSTCLSI
jgi:SAM-dependent methyltransferase